MGDAFDDHRDGVSPFAPRSEGTCAESGVRGLGHGLATAHGGGGGEEGRGPFPTPDDMRLTLLLDELAFKTPELCASDRFATPEDVRFTPLLEELGYEAQEMCAPRDDSYRVPDMWLNHDGGGTLGGAGNNFEERALLDHGGSTGSGSFNSGKCSNGGSSGAPASRR